MRLSSDAIRKIRLLKLPELIELIETQDLMEETLSLTFEERFESLIDQLYQLKSNKKIKSLIKSAKFKYPEATLSSMLFEEERQLNKTMFRNLCSCVFV